MTWALIILLSAACVGLAVWAFLLLSELKTYKDLWDMSGTAAGIWMQKFNCSQRQLALAQLGCRALIHAMREGDSDMAWLWRTIELQREALIESGESITDAEGRAAHWRERWNDAERRWREETGPKRDAVAVVHRTPSYRDNDDLNICDDVLTAPGITADLLEVE